MRYTLILLFVSLGFSGSAQTFLSFDDHGVTYLFKNTVSNENYRKTGYYIGPHVLGDTITMLLNKFESEYVYFVESDGAYSIEEKKFLKPEIYKTVTKLNKHYEKELKKNRIDERDAYNKLNRILTIGIKLKYYQTVELESKLKQIKELIKKEDYLLAVKFKN